MSDLIGAWAKVERAKEHIVNLGLEKTAFLAGDPYGVTPEYYPQPENFTAYFLDKFTPVPLRIGLIAGDAAHNLRSALDLLANALVKRGPGRRKSGHTYFPICESPERYEAEAPRKVEGMLEADIKAIDLLKPYKGGENLLWGLHRLDIIDKHHIVTTPVVAVNRIGIQLSTKLVTRMLGGHLRFRDEDALRREVMWYDIKLPFLASKSGDPVASVQGNHEVDQDIQFTFDVSLGEPEVLKGRPILETFYELTDLVSGIVDSFTLP